MTGSKEKDLAAAPGTSRAQKDATVAPGTGRAQKDAAVEPGDSPLHLDRFIPYRLSVLSNTISMLIASAYEREFGLSIPQWRIMAVLARYPDLSAVEVAERTAMDKVAVSRAVQGLLSSKRVLRAYDKGDRRRSILRLSAAGQAVYTRVSPMALRYEQELLSALSPADQRTLDRLLTRLMDQAQSMQASRDS
ncbi:winged helix-turn-helix transcriptional regulator [Steroidobacter sp. S1-65]|uniref:Winged helix-turn-helix transcriptional regulator n=1 Tax=Steroidobacter gossypii TaxID=2805490 RepID=A0ABS1WQC1_9GAMM|nr:MarR family winged helix-turn-helix transcriptional regulator [Steroidobacter gossypii]MBM0103166.1 winged helix-turn-helix transcriptional regulator [Steroidobacter gossypii]